MIKPYLGASIKNQSILHIISEISETLSLTNEPKQVLETTLDTMSKVLNTDCCWVQLVNTGNDSLPLVACRGFTPDMQRAMASMSLTHHLSQEIVGLGNKIVIPDLIRDGNHDIPEFEKAGFCSLIAVPVMTYRVHGVLGIAYRARKKIDDDFSSLIAVIGGLIGMCLNKFALNKQPPEKTKPLEMNNPTQLEPSAESRDTQSTAVTPGNTINIRRQHQNETKVHSQDFDDHNHQMRVFHRSHQPRSPKR